MSKLRPVVYDRRGRNLPLCILAILLSTPTVSAAQPRPARLSVLVVDPDDKPIPQAQVRVTLDNSVREAETDSTGRVGLEASGRIQLEVRREGFQTVQSGSVNLTAGEIYEVLVPMNPGDPNRIERVDLRLEESVVSERGEPGAREGLPKADRLFGLRGGVNVSGIAEGESQQWVAASGNVFTNSSFSAVGLNATEFSAELGDARGVDDSLPPGDVALHGSAYLFHRNDALNARNYFDPPDQPIPPFKYSFLGVDLGGPLEARSYFFAQYWGLRIRQSITRAATVPDPRWVDGNFSSYSGQILDPETGFPFPGNRIPPNRLHPRGSAIARRYPAPNVAGATVQNYRGVAKLRTSADSGGVRIDHRLTGSDEAFFEYQFNRDTTDDPFNLLSGITNLPLFGVRDSLRTHSIRANNTHIFSPTIVQQVRVTLGFLEQPRTITGGSGDPAVLITGFSNLGHGTNLPQERRNRSIELAADASFGGPRTTRRIGAEYRAFAFQAFMDLYSRGQYQFTGGIFSSHPLANLLLGVPTNALRIQGETDRDFRTRTFSFFAQQDWRPRPDLAVNLGIRYDYQSPFHEESGRVANFDSRLGGVLPAGADSFYLADRNNLGPRAGFSWRTAGAVVIRASYGIFFDTLGAGDSLFLLGLNPPFVRFDLENNGPVLPRFDLGTVFKDPAETIQPSIFSASSVLPNPYLQQWRLSLERDIGQDLTVEAAYLGQKGTRLRRQMNLNQPSPGSLAFLEDRRPYKGFRNIFQFETSASSISHALEARAARRFRAGLGYSVSYRFARLIDDATLISVLPQNSHDLKAERGLGDFDARHRLVITSTYNLPRLRGWQVQLTGAAQSGTPLSAILGADHAGVGNPIVNRPDLVRSPKVMNPTPSRFFDPGAFVPPDSGRFGNAGRNVILGPGTANFDLAVTRIFRVSDSLRAHVRADLYNVLNHPNFVAPPSMQNFADSPDFGALFVARSPRIVQAGVKLLW